jgi:hypothetical protein
VGLPLLFRHQQHHREAVESMILQSSVYRTSSKEAIHSEGRRVKAVKVSSKQVLTRSRWGRRRAGSWLSAVCFS